MAASVVELAGNLVLRQRAKKDILCDGSGWFLIAGNLE